MKRLKAFSTPENQTYYQSHSVQLEPDEHFVVQDATGANWVVVGYRKHAARSNRTGCIFGCEPRWLIVSKQLKSGAPGKAMLFWHQREMPPAAWQKFDELFPLMESFARHRKHQRECAKDLVQEYERNPPDAANWYINRNPYWGDERDNFIRNRENRRYEARQKILQTQADWYADEDLSGVFNALMSYTPPPDQGDVAQRIQAARDLKSKYLRLRGEIFRAHRYEDMRFECKEAREMKDQLDKMVSELAPHLPKVFGVIPLLDAHPGI